MPITVVFEYPDPIVATYMERAARLTAGDRKLLDPVVRNINPFLLPWALVHNLRARFHCAKAIRRSLMGCQDPVVRARYGTFYKGLALDGWKWGAIGLVALGLFAVRLRTQSSARAYDRLLGTVLSRVVIGWHDADTGPDDFAAAVAAASASA